MSDFKIPCPYEGSVLDGKKPFCEAWGRWTNCREAGRCVYEATGGKVEEGDEEDDTP